jgi:hypothetical protein
MFAVTNEKTWSVYRPGGKKEMEWIIAEDLLCGNERFQLP